MKQLALLLSICIAICFCVDSEARNYGDINNVEYVRNYDGDTITVNINMKCMMGQPKFGWPIFGEEISIRIRGIDTPELRGHKERGYEYHHKAVTAKEVVKTMCIGQDITLKNTSRGKYFRIVADVYCNDINISEILLDKGLAIEYLGSGSKF